MLQYGFSLMVETDKRIKEKRKQTRNRRETCGWNCFAGWSVLMDPGNAESKTDVCEI